MSLPKSFLFLFNITKNSNFGFMIRTANAMGAGLIVIGRRKYSTRGAVATTARTPVHHFYTLRDGVAFAREMDCRIVGVEIMPQARSISENPFSGSTAFMTGNEGQGLLPSQIEMCDEFVYIPQFGNAVSLNVNVAAAICLHRFADWAGFGECPREGNQFASGDTSQSLHERFQAARIERLAVRNNNEGEVSP